MNLNFVQYAPASQQLPGPVVDYNFNQNHINEVQKMKNEQNLNQINNGPMNPIYHYRTPTNNNPMMNVPITAYDTEQLYTNYARYDENMTPSDLSNKIETRVEDTWNTLNNSSNLFQDPGDYFYQKSNSQREWYSVPNGSVPNEQDSFASWLYSTPGNCKHGSIYMRYGVKYTNDSLLCSGNSAAEPTNFGFLNK